MSLAAVDVHKMASQVVPCRTPQPPQENKNVSGKFSSLPSQSVTIVSSSVAAGDDIQLKRTALMPVLSISPRNPAVLPLEGKLSKVVRALPVDDAGDDMINDVMKNGLNGFGLIRCRLGQPFLEAAVLNLAANRILVV